MKKTDIKRINNYYLDLLINEKRVLIEKTENGYYITDSYIISVLDPECYYLKELNTYKLYDSFINKININDYKKVNKKLVNKNDKIVILENEESSYMIQEKYYKLYEKYDFFIDISKNERSMVIVKENENIIAYILPVKQY